MFKVELGYGERKITALQLGFVGWGPVAIGEEQTLPSAPRKARNALLEHRDGYNPFGATMKDAQGAAALLLVESLIHGLVANSALSIREAIDIVDVATEVERELDSSGLGPPFGHFRSALAPIARSLEGDLEG